MDNGVQQNLALEVGWIETKARHKEFPTMMS